MASSNRNLWVGITALLGLLAAAWLIFMFGEMPAWTTSAYKVRVHLNDTLGLAIGSRVRINGIDIGEVSAVELADPISDGVLLTCRIEEAYGIPAGSTARVTSGAFGGAGALNIVPPVNRDEVGTLPRDGTAELTGTALSLTDQLADLSQQLSETTKTLAADVQAQLERFGGAADKITELAEQYTTVGRHLEQLVEHRGTAEVDSGSATANLSTVLERTDARMAELGTTLEKVNELLGDETLGSDLRRTVANTKNLTAEATRVVSNAGDRVDQLTRRYTAVADDLGTTLTEVNMLLADARSGKGTLGRLVQDPALYESLNDAAERLGTAIKEATLLIEKWKAEGLPVRL